jgi:hypothetical protein
MSADPTRTFVRHTIATLAYRGAKIVHAAPAGFADVCAESAGAKSRTAAALLAHIGDLLDWTALLVSGEKGWKASPPGDWEHEVERFFTGLRKVDAALAADSLVPSMPLEKIFQGPIADAFTHLGQLAMLRRLAGAPVRSEVLVLSEIVVGRVGPEQAPPVREFD